MIDILSQLLLGLVLATAVTTLVRQFLPKKVHYLTAGSIILSLFWVSIFYINQLLLETKIEIPYIKIGAVKSLETTEPPITTCLKNLSKENIVLKTPKPCSTVKTDKLVLFDWVGVTDRGEELTYFLNISECLYQAPTTSTKKNSLKLTLISNKARRCNWWVTSFYPNGTPGPSSQQNQFFIE